MSKKPKKSWNLGKIDPNKIKVRDIVHMQEIIRGTGAGYHRSKKDWNRRESRKQEKEDDNE